MFGTLGWARCVGMSALITHNMTERCRRQPGKEATPMLLAVFGEVKGCGVPVVKESNKRTAKLFFTVGGTSLSTAKGVETSAT